MCLIVALVTVDHLGRECVYILSQKMRPDFNNGSGQYHVIIINSHSWGLAAHAHAALRCRPLHRLLCRGLRPGPLALDHAARPVVGLDDVLGLPMKVPAVLLPRAVVLDLAGGPLRRATRRSNANPLLVFRRHCGTFRSPPG